MKELDANIIYAKTKNFAIRIVKLYQHLSGSRKEFVLSKQLLRSGTSIGANIKEAIRGQSRADFGAKMNISLKEASESEYWIDLLYQGNYISLVEYESLMHDCQEIIRILTSIVKTTFNKNL